MRIASLLLCLDALDLMGEQNGHGNVRAVLLFIGLTPTDASSIMDAQDCAAKDA